MATFEHQLFVLASEVARAREILAALEAAEDEAATLGSEDAEGGEDGRSEGTEDAP